MIVINPVLILLFSAKVELKCIVLTEKMAAIMSANAKTTLYYISVVLCFAMLVRESNSLPSPPSAFTSSYIFTESADCKADEELLDLCQRCAKATRSRLAYPKCCSKDLVARKWCYDFIYFTV